MKIHNQIREALLPILPASMDIARRFSLPCEYKAGNRPRHFAGNLADPLAVRLILLLAEPGSAPGAEEINRDEVTWLQDVTCDGLGNGGFRLRYDDRSIGPYEINPREFIKMIWPDESYAERMEKVVITNSFSMQAWTSGGPIPPQAAKEYGVYLKRFINVFSNATIVAAGKKAENRALWARIPALPIRAFTPPGSNQQAASISWRMAAEAIRAGLGLTCHDNV